MQKLRYLNVVLIAVVLITGFTTATVSVASQCDKGYEYHSVEDICEKIGLAADIQRRLECLDFPGGLDDIGDVIDNWSDLNLLEIPQTESYQQHYDAIHNQVTDYAFGEINYDLFYELMPKVVQEMLFSPAEMPKSCL